MVIEYFLDWVQTASVEKRMAGATAIAKACTRAGVDSEERDEIEAALTVLLDDNAPSVRLAIAATLGAHSTAPRHIVNALANDNADISAVILSQSSVFHDAELINFVRKGTEKNQVAISCRPWLSAEVVTAICEFGCRDAVLGVLMNDAANLTPSDLHQIANRHGIDAEIRSILTSREDLSAETRHLLLGKLGEALGGFVKNKAWMPEQRLNQAIGEAFDRASIIFAAKTSDEDVHSVVRNLIAQERLTVSFLVRAICMGNITLVACAFSELSGVRFSRVEAILANNRQSALKAVYDRAGLPKSAFIVFCTAIKTWREVLTSKSQMDQARLPFVVTRETLSAYLSGNEGVVDELLVLLRKLVAETARESSKAKAQEITERKADLAQPLPNVAKLENQAETEFQRHNLTVVEADQVLEAIDIHVEDETGTSHVPLDKSAKPAANTHNVPKVIAYEPAVIAA